MTEVYTQKLISISIKQMHVTCIDTFSVLYAHEFFGKYIRDPIILGQ